MLDRSKTSEGELGEGIWFSSLLLSAIQRTFTGLVSVKAPAGDAVVFFREGQPLHASGAGFSDHHLGQVLLARGLCKPDQVEAALAEQGRFEGQRPLLGTLLERQGLDPAETKRAVQAQTMARLAALMQLGAGKWISAPGDDPRFGDVGVPLDPWATFFELLQTRASDKELSHQADALLGSAVRLKEGPMPQQDWTAEARQLLKFLKKPRKPDQLERAIKKRRMVRGFLRALTLMDRIEIVPATSARPIREALTHQVGVIGSGTIDVGAVNGAQPKSEMNPQLRDVARSKPPKRPHPLVAEIAKFHESMADKNYFELLGVQKNLDTADLRSRFQELTKKFHPDSLPTEIERAGETAEQAAEIFDRLKQAYDTLNDEERRVDYSRILEDERIKGDYKKLEKIRDAEMKCKMGVVHLRKREFARARELFRAAHENDPSAGLYQAYLAYSMFADPSQNRSETIERSYDMLMEALDKDKEEAVIHLYLGYVLKAKDRPRDALHHFKKVLRYSPHHADASSEVRFLRRRIEADENAKKTGLARFFRFGDKNKSPPKKPPRRK